MNSVTRVYTSDEILQIGMKCLVEALGHVNAEQFINTVRANCPDYTLWRRKILDDLLKTRVASHQAYDNGPENKYIYYFILDGSISMVLHWIDNDFDLSTDDFARQIDSLCYPVYERYFC